MKTSKNKTTTGTPYNDDIYDYVFHFNIYTKQWAAIHREDYHTHLNGLPTKHRVIRSSSINTCIELVHRGEDFVKNIK